MSTKTGEIDILEYHNNLEWGWGRYTGGPAAHINGVDLFITDGDKGRQEDMRDGILPDSEGYHTFGCLWTVGKIQWYIDRKLCQTAEY